VQRVQDHVLPRLLSSLAHEGGELWIAMVVGAGLDKLGHGS
jgi:hypothetical protein